jgi:hypothetical protein
VPPMHAAATLKAVATALMGMLTLQAEFVGTCGETWQAFLTDPWRAVLAVALAERIVNADLDVNRNFLKLRCQQREL